MVPVEVRPAASQVARERLRRLATDRDDALLPSLAEAADEAAVDVDGDAIQPDRLADAQPRAVEKLDERVIAHGPRRRAKRGLDQALGLARGERPRQRTGPPGQLEVGRRVVGPGSEQRLVAVERP